MALLVSHVVIFRCVRCGKDTPSELRPRDYVHKKHRRSCDMCGKMMEPLEATKRELVPETEEMTAAKNKATGMDKYLDPYICLFYFR